MSGDVFGSRATAGRASALEHYERIVAVAIVSFVAVGG